MLAPRFNFTPKNPNSGRIEGFDYGEGGYDPKKCNVGFNEETGQFQIEITSRFETTTDVRSTAAFGGNPDIEQTSPND